MLMGLSQVWEGGGDFAYFFSNKQVEIIYYLLVDLFAPSQENLQFTV